MWANGPWGYAPKRMDFAVTEGFSEAYDGLSDENAMELDAAIRQLLDDHGAASARAGRIEGSEEADFGGAWILRIPMGDTLHNVYWEYLDSETVVLVALVPAP